MIREWEVIFLEEHNERKLNYVQLEVLSLLTMSELQTC